ncbi:MAG: hypothetical protein E5X58_35275 [Mesorhizobium sp.]|nr:MAG: hypothetical protein E5X58_35275 [Mesorhizobium sp.]
MWASKRVSSCSMAVAGRILKHHAAGFEHPEKMTQRRLQLMTQTTDRVGAGARRLVLRQKAHDSALADRF